MAVKPPLGLIRKEFATDRTDEERLEEVKAAIARYLAVNKTLPKRFTDEYNALTKKLTVIELTNQPAV